MRKLIWTLLVVCRFSLAHGGDDAVGALPPTPHGGRAAEAEHSDGHAEEAGEDELFFEAHYKNKELVICPLVRKATDNVLFGRVSPKKDLSKVRLTVFYPREKRTETVNGKIGDSEIRAAFDPKGAYRFIVTVEAEYQKEMKTAQVQIENE